jgi:uncharacterized membrane protein
MRRQSRLFTGFPYTYASLAANVGTGRHEGYHLSLSGFRLSHRHIFVPIRFRVVIWLHIYCVRAPTMRSVTRVNVEVRVL